MNGVINITQLLNQQQAAEAQKANEAWDIQPSSTPQTPASAIISIIDGLSTSDNNTVHFYTDGSFSLHQLLIALVEYTGPCTMHVSTYAMSETSARTISMLKETGLIKQLHCLIDNRSDTRSAASLQFIRSLSATIALAPCHAKATILTGVEKTVAIIGSANYTENKRMECGIVTNDAQACQFHRTWITTTIRKHGR